MEERVAELERKMEAVIAVLKILSKWVETQMEIVDCDTNILKRLNERVIELEDRAMRFTK